MEDLEERLENINWPEIESALHNNGYALVNNLLSRQECVEVIDGYHTGNFRKTVVMERYRFGLGEYKYFDYPLPPLLNDIREAVYPRLARIANQWMEDLGIDKRLPLTHQELKLECQQAGQDKPTALILKYGRGGFNTLHQDLYGEIYFPMQLVLFLNQHGVDYTGGEFVLTEQKPRAQSKAIVLQPNRGDMLIFTTNFRPVKGNKGYYRVNIKHGVSPLHAGKRYTLGIIFHDAMS